ncbi:MAG: LamG-like jellyroll fold domain-containing protein, partial [Planctomycetota bacterium]
MSKKLVYLVSLLLVLRLAGGAVADPLQQDPGPDGIVSVEAEDYDENTPKPPHTWEYITEAAGGFTPPGGWSGGAAMQSTPTTPAAGAGFNDPADFLANSPRLDYEVNFVKTGTHYVWVLAWGLDGNSDSLHSGLDGEHVPTADRIGGINNNLTWTNSAYQDPERIMFDVPTTGIHILNIWMREDGSVVDKIVLTTDPAYRPTGQGPPESHRGPLLQAYNPSPADGALYLDTWATLTWSSGETAVSHDVYFGESLTDVNEGVAETFRGNQPSTYFIVGFPGFPYPDGLVPGTTYYWRIDEVEADGTTKHKGLVWNFTVPPQKAYNPTPTDGAQLVDTDVTLSWAGGLNVKLHHVYFGDDPDVVANASGALPQTNTTYTPPSALELDKVYYWRVDQFDGATMHKGDVWSFKTLPAIPVTDPNLVGWWKFEAGSGTVTVDFSGHGNNGTIVDNVLWVPGMFNLALEFMGDDEGHVELPPGIVNTASGSVMMWVNTDLTDDEGMFWYGTETGGDGFGDENEIHINVDDPGVLGFWIVGTGLGGPQLAGAGWTHVTATWDLTDGCRLYANAVEVDFEAHNNTVVDLAVMRLGKPVGTGNGNRYYQGLMDDVRLFDHAISAAQVNEIMSKGEDPLKAGAPKPRNGALVSIDDATPLTWSPGENVSQHDVYFGTDKDAVANADASDLAGVYRGRQSGTTYTPSEGVEWGGGPYYWRIDEYNNDGTISKGGIWSFTVSDFILVEDFESYTDNDAANEA